MLKNSLVAAVIWLLSLPAVFVSVAVLPVGLMSVADDATFQNFLTLALGAIACHAWLALLVLTIGWIRQKPMPMGWVQTGTACAVVAIAVFA